MKISTAIVAAIILIAISLKSDAKVDSLQTIITEKSGIERINMLNEIASLTIKTDTLLAKQSAKEALELALDTDYKFGIAQANYQLGMVARYQNKLKESIRFLQKAQKIQIDNPELKTKGNYLNIYHYLGSIYQQMGDYHKALSLYEEMLEESKAIENEFTTVSSHISIASINCKLGNFEVARSHNEIALALDDIATIPGRRANIYNNLGITFKNQGYYELSIEFLLKSLKLKLENGDSLRTGSTLNNIGLSYKYLANYPLALEYYQRSLRIKEQANNKKGIAKSYNNIAIVYEEMKEYDLAVKYYTKSLKLKEELGMKLGIAITLNNLGKMYLVLDDYEKSYNLLKRSLSIKEELNNRVGLAETLNHLGNYYLQTGDYDKAEEVLTKEIIIAEELKLRSSMKYNYKLQSELAIARKDYLTALNWLGKYDNIKEIIFNETKSAQIAEQHIRFETEKKEQEIDLLTRDNKIMDLDIKQRRMIEGFMVVALFIFVAWVLLLISSSRAKRRANLELSEANSQINKQKIELEENNGRQKELLQELKKANAAKDKFFSIIAHDLKSPLAVQKSGTKILAKHISTLSKQEVVKIAVAMAENVDVLDRLLDNLLQWSRLQKGSFPLNPIGINLWRLLRFV